MSLDHLINLFLKKTSKVLTGNVLGKQGIGLASRRKHIQLILKYQFLVLYWSQEDKQIQKHSDLLFQYTGTVFPAEFLANVSIANYGKIFSAQPNLSSWLYFYSQEGAGMLQQL